MSTTSILDIHNTNDLKIHTHYIENSDLYYDEDSGQFKMASAEFTSRIVGTYLLLFGLVFGLSAAVDKRSFQTQILKKEAWLTALFIQFVLLPLVGFIVVKSLNLDFASGITLLLITSSPGGTYSNWYCAFFNGDVALSVAMTSISSMLSLIMIPCNLILYASNLYDEVLIDSIQWSNVFLSLSVVLAAIIAGSYFSAKLQSEQFNILAHTLGSVNGGFLILFKVLVIIYADDIKIRIFGQPWSYYFGLASPCIAGLCLSLTFSGFFQMSKPECFSLEIECFFQNLTIALAFVLAMFEGDTLQKVLEIVLFYGIVQFVTLVLFGTVAWKLGWTRAPKDDSIINFFMKPYGIIHDEKEETTERESQDTNKEVKFISDAHVINVEDEFVDNAFVEVDLQSPVVMNLSLVETQVKERDVYLDDGSVKKRKKFIFRNKAKVMDAQAPTISPTSVLSPQSFEHTSKDGKSFRRKKKAGRKSYAVKQLIIEETINEDSLAEDPDISIAGESDLESGLSVSVYGDEVSLSGFSFNRPSSRASTRSAKRSIRPTSPHKEQDDDGGKLSLENNYEEILPTTSSIIVHNDVNATDIEQGIDEPPLTVNGVDTSIEHFDEVPLNDHELPESTHHSSTVSSSDVKESFEEVRNQNEESINDAKEPKTVNFGEIDEEIPTLENPNEGMTTRPRTEDVTHFDNVENQAKEDSEEGEQVPDLQIESETSPCEGAPVVNEIEKENRNHDGDATCSLDNKEDSNTAVESLTDDDHEDTLENQEISPNNEDGQNSDNTFEETQNMQ